MTELSLTNGVDVKIAPEDLGGELQYSGDQAIGELLNALFSNDPMDEEFHYPSIAAEIGSESAIRLSKLVDQLAKDTEDELEYVKREAR